MTTPPHQYRHSTNHAWVIALGHCFVFLALWSVFIKYLFPLIYSAAYGLPLASHIYWDLWPLAHLWLAWALIRQAPYQRRLAAAMSVVEIIIIVTFFARFLSDPGWTIWRTNWFINKVFVLAAFVALLYLVLAKPQYFGKR